MHQDLSHGFVETAVLFQLTVEAQNRFRQEPIFTRNHVRRGHTLSLSKCSTIKFLNSYLFILSAIGSGAGPGLELCASSRQLGLELASSSAGIQGVATTPSPFSCFVQLEV